MINRKSEAIDKKRRDTSLNGDGASSKDRAQLILEKGLEYKIRAQLEREERAKKETEGCTFKPKVNERERRESLSNQSENSLDESKLVFN